MQKKVILCLLPLMIAAGSGMAVQAKTLDVPQDVIEISEELGKQYNICPELIQAICWRESRFTADATGGVVLESCRSIQSFFGTGWTGFP